MNSEKTILTTTCPAAISDIAVPQSGITICACCVPQGCMRCAAVVKETDTAEKNKSKTLENGVPVL